MVITKNTSNSIVLTLTENQSATFHDWLFEFTNKTTGTIKYCLATDISAFPSRYNKFVIIDNSTEQPLTGQLNFDLSGTWGYKVYEMPLNSPPSLDPNGYLAVTEERECIVIDNPITSTVEFNEDGIKNNAVFNEE